MIVFCSSPSCRRQLVVSMTNQLDAAMRAAGWRMERQRYDLRPLPYCPRCQEGDT